jgi:hypothetical protein
MLGVMAVSNSIDVVLSHQNQILLKADSKYLRPMTRNIKLKKWHAKNDIKYKKKKPAKKMSDLDHACFYIGLPDTWMMLMSIDASHYNRASIDKHLLVCQDYLTNAYLA